MIIIILLLTTISLAIYSYKAHKKNIASKINCSVLTKEKDVILNFFQEIGTAFTQSLHLDDLLKLILTCSSRTTQAKGEAIFLIDKETRALKAKIVDGFFPPLKPQNGIAKSKMIAKAKYLNENLFKTTFNLGEGIIGEVALKRKSILIENAAEDDRITKSEVDYLKVHSLIASPLTFQDEVLGVMVAINKYNDAPFNQTDLQLFESLAGQAAISIYNTQLYSQIAEKEKLVRDLQIAKEIQNLLLPKTTPEIDKIEIAAFSDPASKVGGDYYDFIKLDENLCGIAISDVSGKGVPAALIMAMARSILRSLSTNNSSPMQVLKELNSQIFPDIRKDMFISISYLILDAAARTLKIARAGHEPILYFKKASKKIEAVYGHGMVIGLDEGALFNRRINESIIHFEEGDALILYTDGITEAINKNGEEFGMERLHEAIRLSHENSASEIVENICSYVRRFVGETDQSDDLTLLVIKIK